MIQNLTVIENGSDFQVKGASGEVRKYSSAVTTISSYILDGRIAMTKNVTAINEHGKSVVLSLLAINALGIQLIN